MSRSEAAPKPKERIALARATVDDSLPLTPAGANDSGAPPARRLLGRGRGAVVHAVKVKGAEVAVKTFIGSGLAKAVHLACFGSDNPYVWDRTAMEEAHHRRRVLTLLVPYWTEGRARLAPSYFAGWSEEENVNELTMELIEGRGAALRQPFSPRSLDEAADLVANVMRPLQVHLVAAGFDGSAWQAGLYNPVAASNFMLERAGEGSRWVWIDVESGVPALFPANPLGLIRFYIPRAIKYRRPLFDDVDTEKFKAYLTAHEAELRRALGGEGFLALVSSAADLVAALAASRWRTLGRVPRGIEARLARREISRDQAEWYRARPWAWIGREAIRAVGSGLTDLSRALSAWLSPKLWWSIAVETVRLVASAKRREAFARNYVASHIERWRRRKQIGAAEFAELNRELNDAESSIYLTDFGMHLAIKPVVKLSTWGLFPILFGMEVIGETTLAVGVVAGGMIGRTLYTSYRVAASLVARRKAPWAALAIGTLPAVGNTAFPAQILFDGVKRDEKLARFILYCAITRLGELVPIWGGADTLAEHGFNRLADRLLWWRRTEPSSR